MSRYKTIKQLSAQSDRAEKMAMAALFLAGFGSGLLCLMAYWGK